MQTKRRVLIITIVPSPYQRDIFAAMAAREDVDLSVCYLEAKAPENPWPERPLYPYERILPGFVQSVGGFRAQVNWDLPIISEFDFVVLSGFTSPTAQFLMRRRLRGRRWIFWGERLRRNSGCKGFIQEKLAEPISGAVAIVGIGRAAQADYQSRFPKLLHFSIPYHCSLSAFFQVRRFIYPGAPIMFLFCGQMIARKGVDLLLIAFSRLVANGFNVKLLLVGREADLPKFLAMVGTEVRSRIHFAGFQAPEKLPDYFGTCDVFVLPSRYDGWGVVVNQALAAGLPIITTEAVGAGLDFVDSGSNGIRVPPDDIDALYYAMRALVQDRELITCMGARSREKAHEITPEAGAQKWADVFNAIDRTDMRPEFAAGLV